MTPGIAANLVALLALGAWSLRRAWPLTEIVRLRNALLVQPAVKEDFLWTPETVPCDFRRERRPPSQDFIAIVGELDLQSLNDWQKALRIAGHLAEQAQDKGRLQDDLLASYRGIRAGYGYCADFAKVFLALAHAAGLFARQWAFSFDGFGGHGHTIVEVFDRSRGKWLFLDPHNNFHVVDAAGGEPLSALEFRDSLLGRRGPVHMQPNGPGRLGYIHEHKAYDYFRRGTAEWYLWWGNAVFSYYAHPLVRAAGRISRTLAHVAAVLVGVQPRIRIYPAEESRDAARRLFALRRRLKVGAVAGLLLLISLLAQLRLGAQA
jgi:Transglutaminase-like superfamily